MWTIQLFGGLSAHSPQRRVTRFRTQKAASLLVYLACHPAPQPRERLIDMLWPDAEPEVGRHNLSNALSFLRHILEPPGVPPGTIIQADRFAVRLNPCAVTTDVTVFETAAKQAGQPGLPARERLALLEHAVQFYAGPLLPGFYEEWIAPLAQRMETLFVQVIVQLVPLLLQVGGAEAALTYARRAVTVDPLSEEAMLQMMQTLAASGQSGQALRMYRTFEQRLQEELDLHPSSALQRLARQLEQSGSRPTCTMRPEGEPPSTAALEGAPAPTGLTPLTARQEPEELATKTGGRPVFPGRLTGGEFLLRTTTRFFGREEEVARLSRLLSAPRTRLVTLTGPGGTGKTRLALEVAAQLVERTTDLPLAATLTRAVFVPLAPITEPERIYDIILRSLGNLPASDRDPLDQLVQALVSQPDTLLVLDNLEQLAKEGALLVRDLLAKAATVKLLVTSRQKLHIDGEREFHLSPLRTSAGIQTPAELLSIPSIALFADRAQAALPDFQLTERNASAVSQLCDYLEGLPLAIELAAARVAILTPARILEQVQANRLDFLTTRRRDSVSRQRTLRATLDWSYQLLPESGRQFLAQLAVFRGRWTLEAAQAVRLSSKDETLELLTLLRDSSLIEVVDTEEGLRFTLLEMVRQYAEERLQMTEETERVRGRHRDWFLALAEEADSQLNCEDQKLWLRRLDHDYDNLRATLNWIREQDIEESELLLVGALWRYWDRRSYHSEGRQFLRRALERAGEQTGTKARARALTGAGVMAFRQGDLAEAREMHQQSLSISQGLGNRRAMAASMVNQGSVAWAQGDYAAAQSLLTESLSIHRELANTIGSASTLRGLGHLTQWQGDFAAARTCFEESLDLHKQSGDQRNIAFVLEDLGNMVFLQGDLALAHAHYEESLRLRRELGDKYGIALSLGNLGVEARVLGRYNAAHALLEESLTIFKEQGDKQGIVTMLNNLGVLAKAEGNLERAQTVLEEGVTLSRQSGNRSGLASALCSLGTVVAERGNLTSARALLYESLMIRRGMGYKLGIVYSLEGLAAIKLAVAEVQDAVRLWGAAHNLRDTLGVPLLDDRERYSRHLEQARSALGEAAFAAAWEEGHVLTWEQAVANALMEAESGEAGGGGPGSGK